MIIFQSIGIILLTLSPGMALIRLFKIKNNLLLYSIGLGILFNIIIGLIANFTFGFTFISVLCIYVCCIIILIILSWKFGKGFDVKDINWKSFLIPSVLYVLAVLLQWQTTLVSSNLVGSDIHLEYYYSQWTLNDGYWNPNLTLTTMTSALGVTILLPEYSLLTGMDLIWIYKVVAPMMVACMPLVIYQIFKSQFGKLVAFLSVIFFITMPMYTMDLSQLIRQSESEFFFVLMVLVMLDDLSFVKKLILGVLFGIGSIVTHYGMAIGFLGYVLVGSVMVFIIAWLWRKKDILDLQNAMLPRIVLLVIAVISVVAYVGYYSNVNGKLSMWVSNIPKTVVERTLVEAQAGISDTPIDSITGSKDLSRTYLEAPPESTIEVPSFFKKFPFLNPFWREPLVQTAIGLDFGRATLLGKIWRIFQYLVELCLIIGFLYLLFKPNRNIKLQYMAFVITSFCIISGVYLLSTYSYGMGVARVWQITLLFIAPCFILGVAKIGSWISSLFKNNVAINKLVLCSTLIIFVPYFFFNSGIVFELAKMKSTGFIDVPYSIGLSGNRVDIAALFSKEDVIAVDWLKEKIGKGGIVYADANGVKLLIQRLGITMDMDLGTSVAGQIRLLEKMKDNAQGYIFLRKWNVENNSLTFNGEYGCRNSYKIEDLWMIDRKLVLGEVKYDNGARMVLVK